MDRDLIKARIWDHAGATASNDLFGPTKSSGLRAG
jgi:hypothetical protein